MNGRYKKEEDGTAVLLDDSELQHWDLQPLKEKGIEKMKIPLSKTMWLDRGLPEEVRPSIYQQVTQSDINEIKRIIKDSFNDFKDSSGQELSDIEKIIAVDSYLQQNIQYVGCSETCVDGIKYRTSDPKIDEFNKAQKPNAIHSGQPITHHTQILAPLQGKSGERNRGICDNLCYLSTLLLNNPIAKVACYDQSGCVHSMNNIILNDKIYCLDVTQNICAGKNRFQTEQQPNGIFQSSEYNYSATLQTAEGLDIGGDLRTYREHDFTALSGKVMPKGYSGTLNWWKVEKTRKNALEKSRNDGSDPRSIGGINEDYMTLTGKYPHAAEPIPREQIEAAVESLKQKGFGHLFEYPKEPYYNQIAEPIKLAEMHKDADPERM